MNIILKTLLCLSFIVAAYAVFFIVRERDFSAVIFLFLCFPVIFFFVKKYYFSMPLPIQSMLQVIFIGAFIYFFTVALLLIKGISTVGDYNEEVVVVLGASFEKDDKPIKMLEYRLKEVVKYHKKNPNALIVVSGGQCKGENKPESTVMKKYLVSAGIDPSLIMEEDKSLNTFENLQNTKEFLDLYFQGDPYRIAVITSNFHLYRSLSIARSFGVEANGYPAYTSRIALPVNFVQESLSILKNIVLNITKKVKHDN
jgi:uncharacterized SAM-binding protein YcdF (DUF218 family)